jgi:hypothetical protein
MDRSAVAFIVLALAFGCANPSVPLDSSATAATTSSTTSATTNPTGPTTTSGSGGAGGSVPDGPWVNSTANLAGISSVCGTLSYVTTKPNEDMLLAGVADNGLWSSTDGGTSWKALGTGAGSATINNRPHSIVYDPTAPNRYWLSGIYEGHGVYETKDDGNAFQQLGDVTHVDLVAVDFTDPARQLLMAGGHEQSNVLYQSKDGGMTWNNVGTLLPMGRGCTWPLILDSKTQLVGCGVAFGGGGVLRSTDAAMTWTEVSKSGGATAPLRASDGTIYWASPIGQVMIHSMDNGLTWVQSPSSDVGYATPIELPDGSIAALNSSYVMVSKDHAMTWSRVVALPYQDAAELAYSAHRKAIYVWHAACGNGAVPVAADSIMHYDWSP